MYNSPPLCEMLRRSRCVQISFKKNACVILLLYTRFLEKYKEKGRELLSPDGTRLCDIPPVRKGFRELGKFA